MSQRWRLILQRLFNAGQHFDLAIRLDRVQEQQQTNDEGAAMSNLSAPLPKWPDRASRPPSWDRTRPVTVDSGQKPATATWLSRGGYTRARKARRWMPGESQMGNIDSTDWQRAAILSRHTPSRILN